MVRSTAPYWLALLAIVSTDTHTQNYPVRPVRVVTAQSAGSSLDNIVRIVTNKLSDTLGQQFVIDNRGGAGGTIGVEIAARATPDGYTLLAGASSSMIISRFSYRKLPFDVFKDFEPISMIVNADSVMTVNPAVPVKTVKELIALARAQPGKLNMSSAGIGSSSHLAGVMFASMSGINSVHVPYKGGGPMAAAVVGNEAQWCIAPAAALVGHIRAGRLRGIAVAGRNRSLLLPDLPPIAEAGVPDYEYSSWNGIFTPKGTPKPVIDSLFNALQKVLAAPDVKDLYANQGVVPLGSESPAAFDRAFRADNERLERLVKLAGIKPE